MLLLVGIISCKRLEKKDIQLEIKCENCGSLMEDSLLMVKGIYYVNYEHEIGNLTVKFDGGELDSLLINEFLIRKGFIFPEDDSLFVTVVPDCCME